MAFFGTISTAKDDKFNNRVCYIINGVSEFNLVEEAGFILTGKGEPKLFNLFNRPFLTLPSVIISRWNRKKSDGD